MKFINFYILPYMIRSVWISKDILFQDQYNIYDLTGLYRFIGWWVINGWREYPGVTLISSFDLINCVENIDSGSSDFLPHNGIIAQGMLFEWDFLSSQFLKDGYKELEFKKWWDENHIKYFPLLELFKNGSSNENYKLCHLQNPFFNAYEGPLNNGITLIGMGNGILGIGEDARMITSVFHNIGVETKLFPYPKISSENLLDLRLKSFFTNDFKNKINIFAIPAFETLRAIAELGEKILFKKYNIAYWQWELPNLPEEYKIIFNNFDEIWSSSKFTYECMKKLRNENVFYMPFPVEIDAKPKGDRHSFELDAGFYFLSVVDGNSWLSRKNPEGTIKAFQAAFPKSKYKDVRLILKTINTKQNKIWSNLLDIISQDSRITIIDQPFPKEKMLGLISSIDAIVSLHRSEGFGRVPAEAMLLNKPVVVTAYSGNMDYCNDKNAFLVDYDLIPLNKGDYNLWVGQMWAEPKIDSAIEMLKSCYENETLRESLAREGKKFIKNNYSFNKISEIYKTHLKEQNLLN